MPHSPLDIYAQYRFLDPTIFGTSFARFRNRYALMGGYGNYRVVGFQNQEEFRRKYFSIAYQVKIRDVFDMPPEEYPVFSTSLGAEATRVYTELRKQFVADVKDGSVTANNVLTRLLRFQQITSGFVGTDEKNIVDIDNAKESLLADVLEDFAPEEPIVIFCLFTRDIAVCKRIAEKQGRKALELSGTVDEVKEWQSAKAPVLVCQIRSGSLGLDFSRAYYAIYYSVGFFHGDYNQAQARLRNPKKTGTTIHIHLVVRHSVDEQVYESFRKGEDVIKAILAEAKKERQEKLVHA